MQVPTAQPAKTQSGGPQPGQLRSPAAPADNTGPAASTPTPGDTPGYIRGTSAPSIDGRHVGFVAVMLIILALAALTVGLAISAAGGNPANLALRSHGRPVKVTVSGCTAISSGIGQLIQFYDCTGVYTLSGKRYEAPIRGERDSLPAGTVLDAIATPGSPPLVALPGTFSAGSEQWWPAFASASATLVMSALLAWLLRRRSVRIRRVSWLE